MKRIVAKKKYKYPMGLEREYAKQLAGLVAGMFRTIRKEVPDMVKLVKQNHFSLNILYATLHWLRMNLL